MLVTALFNSILVGHLNYEANLEMERAVREQVIGDLGITIGTSMRGCRRGFRLAGLALALAFMLQGVTLRAFEGRIYATLTQGSQTGGLLYTAGTNLLRVELTATNWANAVDIWDCRSGALTLLFPHNRSFVRLKPVSETGSAPPGFPVPPGIGSQPQTPNLPGAGGMPAMPTSPLMGMPMGQMELKATGDKTNLLGFLCEKFEIQQRGETMEIWATDQLLPFQNYVRNQPPRFGPRMIEDRWARLLTAKKLFPLRASLHLSNGPERYRFEVQSVTPQKLKDEDLKLFQPPEGWIEIQPLAF
jgi:hypothetical protein